MIKKNSCFFLANFLFGLLDIQLFFGTLFFLISTLALGAYSNKQNNTQNDLVKRSIEQNIYRLSPYSLNRFGFNVYSQYGEDGIIEEIFRRIGITKGFFVEFGAYDGVYCSNTRYLWEKGWRGVMIEPDQERFLLLGENYAAYPEILVLNEFVTWKKEDKRGRLFDEIRKTYFPTQEIDFLSIDIDGCDFYILKTLQCRPKVICIENGLKWHPLLIREAPESMARNNLHQPIQIVVDYARSIGYESVCTTINLFLIRRDFYRMFVGTPSDALTLWRDAFRVFPNKQYWLDCRHYTYPDIKIFEGDYYEQLMPITLES